MRRLSLLVLLASAATPALAAPADDPESGRHHRDSNSTEQPESRPQRTREIQQSNGDEQRILRAQRVDRSDVRQVEQNHVQQVERGQASQEGRTQIREHLRRQHEQDQAQQTATQSDRGEWRQNHDGAQTSWQARRRQVRTIPDTNVATGPSHSERETYQNRRHTDYRNGNYTRWTNNWRHDNRYNWYNYRNHHRSIFQLGLYYDPFGWNYRPWSVGSYLYPSYYGSNFMLDDPWQYRLPPAYGPYRWVRYWDDALMVNIYTGQVVDVIHNFFW